MSDEANKPEEKPAANASPQPAPDKSAEKPPETQAPKPPEAQAKKPDDKPSPSETPQPAEKSPEAQAQKPGDKPSPSETPQPAEKQPEAQAKKPAEKPSEAQASKPAEKLSDTPSPKPTAAAAAKAPETPPPPPPEAGVYGKFLKEKNIESTPLPLSAGIETMELKGSDLQTAIKLLRDSPTSKLDFLVAVSGVDSPDTFDSVYHLWSYSKKDELVLKVRTPKANVPADKLPEVPSLTPFWPAADWHERETYDLVGIRYIGHHYLRRILNPWDWEGHPLRRDYNQPIDALNDKNPHSMR